MIEILTKENCCGCSACASICPVKCIEMTRDNEGFEYPKIDLDRCLHCDQCEETCPVNSINIMKYSTKGYIAYSKNDRERMNSSSGGVFFELASKVLASEGVVFGASFNEYYLVEHIMIDRIEDLYRLQGSKYLQSSIGEAFKKTEIILKDNKKVLFVGTACQIAGLKQYLKIEYSNLITVDILCHGVPSPKVWQKYLEEIRDDKSIQYISFRDKETGWKNYSFKILFDDGSSKKMTYWDNLYMRMFLENISLRPSCYSCKFKGIPRVSDITLGDCWGVEKHFPSMDDNKGTSVILIHSEAGSKALSSIIENLIIKEASVDQILPPSADSRRPVRRHRNREELFNRLDDVKSLSELSDLLTLSLKNKIKALIKRILINAK